MAEEGIVLASWKADIAIKKAVDGFLVVGNQYGSDELRAFSSPEGLIEWLSRELGAGPIVWSLTLDIWAGNVGVIPEDLVSVPDAGVDPSGHQKALEDNARFIFTKFIQTLLKEEKPEPPLEPKPKKAKKVKEEKPLEEVKEE